MFVRFYILSTLPRKHNHVEQCMLGLLTGSDKPHGAVHALSVSRK